MVSSHLAKKDFQLIEKFTKSLVGVQIKTLELRGEVEGGYDDFDELCSTVTNLANKVTQSVVISNFEMSNLDLELVFK